MARARNPNWMQRFLPLLIATMMALAGCGDDSNSSEPQGGGGESVVPAPAGAESELPPRGTLPEQSDAEMISCLEEAGLSLDEGGEETEISGPNGVVAVLKTFPNLAAARNFTSGLSVDYIAAGPRVALIQPDASDDDVGALGGCIGL